MIRAAIAKLLDEGDVQAHCDIPCGIYSTHQAGIAAETVEKMVKGLQEAGSDTHAIVRYAAAKEEWAEICKRELLILWTDYFKDEHLAQFPDLHERFWRAAKLCSKNKREINLEAASTLRKAVEEIAEVFEKAEGDTAKTYRQKLL